MKRIERVPYFRKYIGAKGVKYYFSPPSYIVKIVEEATGEKIRAKTLPNDFTAARGECLRIYTQTIKPCLKTEVNKDILENSLEYIWDKFCERRGIGCEAKGNERLDHKLSPRTKVDYQRAYKLVSGIKSVNGTPFIKVNLDLITPPIAEKIYLKLYDKAKARWARNGIDLIKLLINFGKYKLAVLHGENAFKNLRIKKETAVQETWKFSEVEIFDAKSKELGMPEIGLAVRLNYHMAQRRDDFFSVQMDSLMAIDGIYYFELTPQKTKRFKIKSFAPITPELYEEIKDRTGRLIKYNSVRTMMNHFVIVKKASEINQKLSFRTLRNTASTELANAGATTEENMSVLGHADADTNIKKYRQNSPEQAINAHKKRMQRFYENKNKTQLNQ